jgi:hypothetical protein
MLEAQILQRRRHSSVCLRGSPWNSNIGPLQALQLADISLLFYIFVINHLKSDIKLKYLKTQSVPRSKHTVSVITTNCLMVYMGRTLQRYGPLQVLSGYI